MTDCYELPPKSYTATEGDRSATAPTAEEAYALLRAISTDACPATLQTEAAKPAPSTLADGKTRGEEIADVLLTMDRIGLWKFIPFETGWGDYLVATANGASIQEPRRYIAMAIDRAIADEREACAELAESPRLGLAVVANGATCCLADVTASHRKSAAAIRARK